MREVILKVRDDIDPHLDANNTVMLTWEGHVYELGLCDENLAALRESLQG